MPAKRDMSKKRPRCSTGSKAQSKTSNNCDRNPKSTAYTSKHPSANGFHVSVQGTRCPGGTNRGRKKGTKSQCYKTGKKGTT